MNEWRAALRSVGLRLAIGMVALLLTIAFFALQGVDAVDHRYWLLYVVFLGSFQIFWTPVIFGFGPPLFRRFASVVIAISMMWIAMYTFFGIRDLD